MRGSKGRKLFFAFSEQRRAMVRGLLRAAFLMTAVAIFTLLPGSGEATLLRFLEMEEMTKISDLIVLAKVGSVESGWDEAHRRLRTRVTLEVQRVFLGSFDGEKLSIALPGGFVAEEDLRQVIPGVPMFAVGEEAVLFLRNDPGLFCPIAGWIQGKFKVVTEAVSGRKMVLDRFGKCRRYVARRNGAAKGEALAGGEKVSVEQFATMIGEIRGGKGLGK